MPIFSPQYETCMHLHHTCFIKKKFVKRMPEVNKAKNSFYFEKTKKYLQTTCLNKSIHNLPTPCLNKSIQVENQYLT